MDWLGTEKTANRDREWPSFDCAVKTARGLGLKSEKEWRKFTKNNEFPNHLPKAPESVYKTEWKGWPYFLWDNKT